MDAEYLCGASGTVPFWEARLERSFQEGILGPHARSDKNKDRSARKSGRYKLKFAGKIPAIRREGGKAERAPR